MHQENLTHPERVPAHARDKGMGVQSDPEADLKTVGSSQYITYLQVGVVSCSYRSHAGRFVASI